MSDMLPTDNDEIEVPAMPEEVISEDMPELDQHERKLAQVKRDRERRLKELEDEQKAYEIKHPGAEWEESKLNELTHLIELRDNNEL